MNMDIYNNVTGGVSLTPKSRTADELTPPSVDLQSYEGCVILVSSGVMTDGTHTIDLEESDDDAVFTQVAAADLLGSKPALTSTSDSSVFKFGYRGNKRYVRVPVVVTGGPVGTNEYGATVLRGAPRHAPV